MNQEQERNKLLEKFWNMNFVEKKKECLQILKRLYWISEDINTLWNIVYNSTDEDDQEVLIKVYTLLLDALYYAKDKQKERVVENLQKAKDSFNEYKQEEENEKILNNQNLDELLKMFN